jgi:menaquinone-specific isochorismate synthase
MTRLVARTVALPEPPDLLAEAGDDGLLWRGEGGGLAAHGVARRLELPGGLADEAAVEAVGEALASMDVDDEVGRPGTGAVAIGALPFDPVAPGTLVVPARVVGRAGDSGWLTTIGPAGVEASPEHPRPAARRGEPPDRFTLESTLSHAEWKTVITDAVDALRRPDFDKVVLARRIDVTANRDFVVSDVLERLVALYPSCMVYSINGFVGASPELLLRRAGDLVESHPLAGTVARSGDSTADAALVAALMASPKARSEHRLVVDGIRTALADACDDLTIPDQPSVLGLRNVSHLATHISGRLSQAARGLTALQLVRLVHPTPAVGGSPTAAAIQYLQKAEGFDRGCYAGPVGWVDGRGDGAWAIGIRCAELSGSIARIYAGNGIVEGSDPSEELAETQLKLQALLAALVRP